MTTFWILWSIGALVALVAIYYFFVGLADGSVSGNNSGIWFLLLTVIAGVLLGSLGLKSQGYLGWAKVLLGVLAIPGFLAGIFLLSVIFFKGRWN